MPTPTETTNGEPVVDVNGYRLHRSQAMTVRVALETFSMQLTEEGTPKVGTVEGNYLDRIREIRKLMGYG